MGPGVLRHRLGKALTLGGTGLGLVRTLLGSSANGANGANGQSGTAPVVAPMPEVIPAPRPEVEAGPDAPPPTQKK